MRRTDAETRGCCTSERVLWLMHHLHADLTSAFALFWFHTQQKENICLSFNISKKPGRPSIWLRTRDRQLDAASSAWAATHVTEAGNILKCISLRCAVENRAQLRIAKYSMCVYEGWEPRGAAADTDRHAGRGELIRSSALSCSNTHNASVPWVASLQ